MSEPARDRHDIHEVAAAGFSSAADRYEVGRPDYPPAAIAHVIEVLAIGSGRTVLDLAAGTGKLTRMLVPSGATLIAVEPIDAMSVHLRRTAPTVDVRSGTAEAIPLPADSVDVVTVAQAFHWFEPAAAAAEIARVLRPGGGFAALWNNRVVDSWPWDEEQKIVAGYRNGAPHHADDDEWIPAVEALGIGPLEVATFEHRQVVAPDVFLDRVISTSYLAALTGAEQLRLEHQLRTVVADHDAIELHYTTEVFTGRLWSDR
jgi:SAM-dependent methyltransferase